MLVHPADHVQDQQAGYQQHRALEPFATAAGQPVAGLQHAPAQRAGQAEPGGDAGPEHAQGVAGTRLLTQPACRMPMTSRASTLSRQTINMDWPMGFSSENYLAMISPSGRSIWNSSKNG